jgi:hypothetical protein
VISCYCDRWSGSSRLDMVLVAAGYSGGAGQGAVVFGCSPTGPVRARTGPPVDDDRDVAAYRAYETIQSLLVSLNDVQSFLIELAGLAATLMPAVECGITSRYNGNVITVASNSTSV